VEGLRRLDEDSIQYLGGDWGTLFRELPFEGTVVYRSRHHELIEETKLPEEALKPLADALGKSEPNPYLAVLMADGDRMGEVISKLDTPDKHREFSRTLSRFASKASEIVRNHRGVLIYSGGDDVLAFLPVDKCLACARTLHDTFGDLLQGYKVDQHSPTLSVGIAIAHFMDDLEELRQYALDAEKSAKKPDRDGLAVHLHKRSGSPTCVRSRWSAKPDVTLMRYADWVRHDAIPSKLPYDLRKLVPIYDDKNWQDANTRQKALQADVLRIIKDKQPRGARSAMPQIASAIESRVKDSRSLETFCEELLVARLIAEVMEQAEPRKSSRQVAEVKS
jgi:CRISPR-associated protein Cmr2